MKLTCLLLFMAVCAFDGRLAVAGKYNNPVVIPTTTPQASLSQEIREILHLIPFNDIQDLIIRYLLNDAQFQSFVRIINSHDGYLAQLRFHVQPEVLQFTTWARKIKLSEGDLPSDESGESSESFCIINRTPLWSENVFGWQGFVKEFKLYYPEEIIRRNVQAKAAESSVFAEFVHRLKNLKPAYEHVIASPEGKRVIDALQTNGISTADIDNFIRNQFGWQQTSDNNDVQVQ